MSKIALSGNPSGTGTFTIASPNSNTDRTLNLPDAAGTIVAKSGTYIAPSELGAGTADNTTFLRGDNTWAAVPSPTIASTAEAEAGTNNTNFITPLRMREGFNASGSAPVYACRAWVNFNGTGTVAIRASGNVSSITDNGTGDYTVNFTTAMPDANYAAVHPTMLLSGTGITYTVANYARTPNTEQAPTTSAYRFSATDGSAGPRDLAFCYVAFFR